ncbi:DUF4097 family beta strand repeat-containing protein [Actinoplanes sp. NPDC026619]|uniref:DUF4097 family beta strand repeat-containing protein n=1 Tax=Actinoplanes sp. NPDC026619 TaxID=3155798 RepID=UPI00340A0EF2
MYEFDHSTPVTLVLRAQGGLVEITAEERASIQVDVQPLDSSEAAQDAAQKTRVELDDGTLLIQAPGSEHWLWRRTPKLRITARVPIGSSLHAKSAAADLRATGVYSAAHITAASADIDVAEVTGDAHLDSASGDIVVGRVGGGLHIKSASGALHIGDVTGDVNAQTASGNIRAGSLESSVRAGSASGDIGVGRLRQGQASVKTASGDVQVGVAAGSGVWMDLSTASGRSTSDLTATGDVPPADNPITLELKIRTASGNIHVHRAVDTAKAA